ncbi:MAG: hypothetical protein M3P26_15140 [Gemmatimonadota bacterium]|nr:hypothetical protein [Gemmatimonadota bacterium]
MVPRIEIDDDVLHHLQSKAIAYVESPNDTLRRLLGLTTVSTRLNASSSIAGVRTASRRPKASLGRLIKAGLIKNGQKLYLQDYQGRQVPGIEAFVGGDGIFANADRNRLYSMSDLAGEILKKNGYKADAVRGPSHWFTENGKSITQLWEEHLDRNGASV